MVRMVRAVGAAGGPKICRLVAKMASFYYWWSSVWTTRGTLKPEGGALGLGGSGRTEGRLQRQTRAFEEPDRRTWGPGRSIRRPGRAWHRSLALRGSAAASDLRREL